MVWETNKETKKTIVYIHDCKGFQKLANPDRISTRLKASSLSALRLVFDADEYPERRWQSIRNASLASIPDLPEDLPEEGLIHSTPNGINFGVWMMPDNKMRGMLETFLAYMLPDENRELWQFALTATQEAKNKGAPFVDSHLDKANIYTWLAWQEPPGRQLHDAIKQRILNPKHPNTQRFVAWFRNLYGI